LHPLYVVQNLHHYLDDHGAGSCALQFFGDKAAAGWGSHNVAGVLLRKSTYMHSSWPGAWGYQSLI
jgi:hypothetical protein